MALRIIRIFEWSILFQAHPHLNRVLRLIRESFMKPNATPSWKTCYMIASLILILIWLLLQPLNYRQSFYSWISLLWFQQLGIHFTKQLHLLSLSQCL